MRNKTGRAKPVTPKAGVTKTSRRYTYGEAWVNLDGTELA